MRCIYCLKNNAEYVVAGSSICEECLKKKSKKQNIKDKYNVTREDCSDE